MEPVIEPVFSLLQEPEKSDIEECAGNCILSENEIERALSEHLKQDVLPQLPEAHSPDWGAASPQREQEAACNKPPHRKRASKKLALVANVQKLHTEEKPYKCTECDANHSEATFLHHKEEQRCGTEKHTMDHLSLVLEELKKMRENMDMLLLNQQSQLQVLQEIQKQLNILLPGNDLINSNVYSLGLLLGRQAAAVASLSFPLLNPSSLLPENASCLPQSSAPGILPTTRLPVSQHPATSTT
ncbi:uncharacterized protein LOC110364716 isoform X3 [Columba livia]|uniref:uncharacterized protein LOC110364716 isoform X3 n=1 Tax=Columba livia TaxID=8932 RepID=UPI0031BA16CC